MNSILYIYLQESEFTSADACCHECRFPWSYRDRVNVILYWHECQSTLSLSPLLPCLLILITCRLIGCSTDVSNDPNPMWVYMKYIYVAVLCRKRTLFCFDQNRVFHTYRHQKACCVHFSIAIAIAHLRDEVLIVKRYPFGRSFIINFWMVSKN